MTRLTLATSWQVPTRDNLRLCAVMPSCRHAFMRLPHPLLALVLQTQPTAPEDKPEMPTMGLHDIMEAKLGF